MSRTFQLQLVRKTLTDLGYADVADMLAQRLAAEPDTFPEGDFVADPLLQLIRAGDYDALCGLFSGPCGGNGVKTDVADASENIDELGSGPATTTSVASLSANERTLAHYLVLRASFLERILYIVLGSAPPEAATDAFRFLQERVSVAFDAIDRHDVSVPFVLKLSKERESALLLPLAMSPPKRDQIETALFNASVLLALSDGTTSALSDYSNIPDDCLSEIIHKAALYNESQSLYHLPSRALRPKEENPIGEYVVLERATRDDLPIHLLYTLSHHTDEVWFARFSPSGRFLATGSLDGTCMLYDVTDNFRLLAELDPNAENELAAFVKDSYVPPLDKKKGIIYFSWEPHERYIVTCCLDTVVRVWNIEHIVPRRRVTRSMNGSESAVLVSCFTLGERMRTWPCEFLKYEKEATPHFIVGSPDKVLKVFSIDGEEVLDFYSDADEWLSILGEDPSPMSAASTEIPSSSQGARRTDEASHVSSEETGTSGDGASQFNRINDLAITPNGRVLITANNDKQVFFYKIPNLFDPSTTTFRIALLSLNGRLTSCSISADGRFMLLSIAPEELQLWDISPLENFEKPFLKQKFLGQSQTIYMVRSCFGYLQSPNTREELVLSGSDDGYIYIWKVETGQLITRVKGHEGLCNSVDWNRYYFSKTGKDYGLYWCSVGDDNLVKIWGPKELHLKTTNLTC
ncbi:WD40 repeat-like protein [Metschnikowia bicuspidata var. bicuspidata NRRL YB-4993]|uniref:WD40 repeat-like protein n=1 Tax=Metschnikowia bicuspidata var. bicuspidata NRRL YB-4993 TaxID=869754 RepID=A0A1A0HEJ6_9ASCO|nr:WD40 repeat-like protein [Metschnikowia bicuspidata var. bicuspidata NRRL YB-4993]OBA22416.1 WD40 repeat-like protein [Metschnikowia bicuspidata var. bicuspidata NRRL YB-4993]